MSKYSKTGKILLTGLLAGASAFGSDSDQKLCQSIYETHIKCHGRAKVLLKEVATEESKLHKDMPLSYWYQRALFQADNNHDQRVSKKEAIRYHRKKIPRI